jgi:5'-nucleotidase
MAVPSSHLVNDTSAKAAAIIQAHQAYVYDVPSRRHRRSTRPVLQTGNYAANVGKIRRPIDPTTKQVGCNAANVAVTAASPTCQANAQWQQGAAIVDAAVNYAKPIAAEVIGSATAPITRAYLGTSKDDRSRESTMSNILAQQVLESINAMEGYSADLAFQNPGGVREDLIPGEGNKLNYGQAALVVPFNNTLKTADYTGAQIKAILEEQWQPDGASRPFLAMGVSDNLTYTIDPTKARGERVTSIMLDGAPIDPAATYTVASNAFLITNVGAAPDNFKTFQAGTNYRDTLVQDLDAFVAWIKANSPLSPSFAQSPRHAATRWKRPIFAALGRAKSDLTVRNGPDLLGSPRTRVHRLPRDAQHWHGDDHHDGVRHPLPARTGVHNHLHGAG